MISIKNMNEFTNDYINLSHGELEIKYNMKFKQIMIFASKNGIYRRKWSEHDKKLLKNDYLTMNNQALEKKYKRSFTAIQKMAERLGVLRQIHN